MNWEEAKKEIAKGNIVTRDYHNEFIKEATVEGDWGPSTDDLSSTNWEVVPTVPVGAIRRSFAIKQAGDR